MKEPTVSPWGKIQTCRALCPGVYEVNTAGHGGIMAERTVAGRIFSDAARKHSFREYGYVCFEEDCQAAIAFRELMDRGLYATPVNEYFGPGEFAACIDDSIQRFYPDYWKAREDGLTQEPKQIKIKEFER
jgi:hypothetical protein